MQSEEAARSHSRFIGRRWDASGDQACDNLTYPARGPA